MAHEAANGPESVEGPLKGYHHETYVVPLPDSGVRVKLREPRRGLLWFDRRCFASEDDLLRQLHGRVTRIPEIIEVDRGLLVQRFIEGRTLGHGVLTSKALSVRHRAQLGALFAELAALRIDDFDEFGTQWLCDGAERLVVHQLLRFTEERVYREQGAPYRTLFDDLGVREGALDGLARQAETLTARPFSLLHGDLHRRNFIVDAAGDLWTIDWELAMIGDPLYDLATHLHLMRYSAQEEGRICRLWRRAVGERCPEGVAGWEADLPVLLAYKRAQSVYTDVIRAALDLRGSDGRADLRQLPRVARRIAEVLGAAQAPLGLTVLPSVREVSAAYMCWLGVRRRTVTAAAAAAA
ncbi:phosphotransferase family protein [Streptomyces sp. NPDC059651]|uniref:phosphotransferase family protein n=1 Tax=Streptomyces sp. NPDC059651 TaxID=3346897 RepID=UPI0036CA4831